MPARHIHDAELRAIIERADAVRRDSRRLIEEARDQVARLRAEIEVSRVLRSSGVTVVRSGVGERRGITHAG
jgi:hypothetical protein